MQNHFDHFDQRILYISIKRVHTANKLDRMMTSLDGFLPIMSHDLFITWPCEIRGSRIGGGSPRKRLSRHQLLVVIFSTNWIENMI